MPKSSARDLSVLAAAAVLCSERGLSPAHTQTHYGKYEPTILELKRKYESAMKEKMLASLERDKMAAKVSSRSCSKSHL